MSSDMTPQINKAVNNYRALLESRGVKFPTDAFQSVLGNQAFSTAQFELLRDYVEMSTGILVRDVTVDLRILVNTFASPKHHLEWCFKLNTHV